MVFFLEANNTTNNNDPSTSPIYTFQRLAVRSGIYMPRVPGLPKLDFRAEAVYTDAPTTRSLNGRYVYWNDFYHDLYTNDKNLIGDWIGREGTGFQGFSTYWFSPRNSLQFDIDTRRSLPTSSPGRNTERWFCNGELAIAARMESLGPLSNMRSGSLQF